MTTPTRNSPQLGRLATPDDFQALGYNLQDMLNMTDQKVLHCQDAWAEGNTDCAFACNNFVGVQRSHADNDWNWNWVDLAKQGRGTYVYAASEPYKIMDLAPSKVDVKPIVKVPISNTLDTSASVTQSYTETESHTTSITKSWAVGLKLSTKFELFGQGFDFEASFHTSEENQNTKTEEISKTTSVQVNLPPHSHYFIEVTQYKTTLQSQYGMDLVIGSDNPDGSIGKCCSGDQRNWDKFYTVERVLGTGKDRQTAKWNVENVQVTTEVKLLPASDTEPSGAQIVEKKVHQVQMVTTTKCPPAKASESLEAQIARKKLLGQPLV